MDEQLVPVLKQMCSVVGADYDTIDFKSPDWYTQYEWTKDQENDFQDWLEAYLRADKKTLSYFTRGSFANKSLITKLAAEFIWQYGWKLKLETKTNL